jgi:hypothetical protein
MHYIIEYYLNINKKSKLEHSILLSIEILKKRNLQRNNSQPTKHSPTPNTYTSIFERSKAPQKYINLRH